MRIKVVREDHQFENALNLMNLDYPPDYYKSISVIVQENGFVYDELEVTTKDHYKLTMMRVRQPNLPKGAPAIFMQHGLFDSADAWIANTPETAPAFVFARLGYDVWLGNNRGNSYSRKNTEINPDNEEEKFFNYSFE